MTQNPDSNKIAEEQNTAKETECEESKLEVVHTESEEPQSEVVHTESNNVIELKKDTVEVLHKKAVQRFNSLTYAIIGEISSMLSKAKLMPIPELQAHNPTFDKVVEQLRLYRALSEKVADLLGIDEKQDLALLDDYIELADDLAQAIIADSFDALCGAIAALDEKPYI